MLCSAFCGPVSRLRCARLAPFRSASAPARRTVAAHAQAGERVVKVAHILLAAEQSSLADEIESKLVGGAAFDDLARKHSSCGSAKKGGELGWITRGTFFPQFEAVAFAAPVGAVVRATTGRGLHVIKILNDKYQSSVQQMPVEALAELLASPALLEDVQLVDVREQWEWQLARLPGFRLMPLSQFSEWSGDIAQRLDPERETVVLCHHGVRSMQMSQFLVQSGFTDVKNVTGGIDNYSRVDASVPLY